MKQFKKPVLYFFSAFHSNTDCLKPLYIEGFLGNHGIHLPVSRGKKTGASRKIPSYLICSLTLTPPPIRPMVVSYPFFRRPVTQCKSQNFIGECA
ncbi:hypothetical protein [Planococcus sp. CAU13]|uniref:hypothetical protein n=1 Tax=Planococcus sp. CAU13 TaxID=1541197 RepID=UPI00052FE20B|nr:hypothetical protein [Planococcus sp. CAU13]